MSHACAYQKSVIVVYLACLSGNVGDGTGEGFGGVACVISCFNSGLSGFFSNVSKNCCNGLSASAFKVGDNGGSAAPISGLFPIIAYQTHRIRARVIYIHR